VTLATRFSVGFLIPHNYGSTLQQGEGTVDQTDPAVLRDEQLILLRGFFRVARTPTAATRFAE